MTPLAPQITPSLTLTGEEIDRELANKIFDLRDTLPSTARDYKACLGHFLAFIRNGEFNQNTFLDFKRSLSERTDLSTSTKNKYLATAKIFLKEVSRQSGRSDITLGIKSFTQSKKHKREGLNDEEIAKLTEAVSALPEKPENARLKAILSLLLFQGLRQIEITRLDHADIDLVAKTALIQGKGRDDKEAISLHPETTKALKGYLVASETASGALFTSRSNNSRNKRLTTRGLRNVIKALLKGLEIDRTTHGFRHFFTSKLIRTYKADLLRVAFYTRHKNLEMLQVYNDNINNKRDLPRFYRAFAGVRF